MCQSVFGEVPIKTKYIDLTGYITCMFSSRQQESVFAIKKEVSCIMTSAHLSQVEKRITSLVSLKTEKVTLPKTNSSPLKMVVGSLLSYWVLVTFQGRTVTLRDTFLQQKS